MLGPVQGIQTAGTRPKDTLGPQDLSESARAFEGMLWTQIFQAMRKTVEPSGLLEDSGQARSTYDMLLDQAIVEAAVKGGREMPLASRIEAAWKARETSGAPGAMIPGIDLPR